MHDATYRILYEIFYGPSKQGTQWLLKKEVMTTFIKINAYLLYIIFVIMLY